MLCKFIDRDGTGQGYDLNILNLIPSNSSIQVILSGGAGNYKYFIEGLRDSELMLFLLPIFLILWEMD